MTNLINRSQHPETVDHDRALEEELPTCSCCGGSLPAVHGPELDALDRYLTRADGMCPGHIREVGHIIGCGAWSAGAYR